METFKVVYQHGHFIDKASKQRIIPVQGAEYVITASPNAFTTEDAKLKMAQPLTAKEKALWAEAEFHKGNYMKIMSAGEQLFFRVGNSKKIQGDENKEFIFVCTLLEDLYFYLSKEKKGDEEGDWRLGECQCFLENCLMGGLTLTEKIPAPSLNTLFSYTVMFYFSMQRSGSCNAFNTFFKYERGMKIDFDGASKQLYNSLGKVRKDFVIAIRKEKLSQ